MQLPPSLELLYSGLLYSRSSRGSKLGRFPVDLIYFHCTKINGNIGEVDSGMSYRGLVHLLPHFLSTTKSLLTEDEHSS
jgi:hypothetical protein